MAKVESRGWTALEIHPVSPSHEGPHDAYDVRIWHGDDIVFDHQYNVVGWQLGHSEVVNIARSFEVAHRLLDQNLPVDLYDTTHTVKYEVQEGRRYHPFNPPMHLHRDVIWMHVLLSADTYRQQGNKPPEEVVTLRLFLWTSPDEDYDPGQSPSEHMTRFVSDDFSFNIPEITRFGAELHAECIETQRLRRELGLEHFDDWIDFG